VNSDQKEKRMDCREITRRRLSTHGDPAMARQVASKKIKIINRFQFKYIRNYSRSQAEGV
jgi:hypothetical protein